MSVKQISIRTDGSGAYTYTRSFKGVIYGIELVIGTLSTPDIDVTDSKYSKTLLSVDGVAADTMYTPSEFLQAADATTAALVGTGMKAAAPAAIMGTLSVAVTGGGANTRGTVYILYA